jgi:hypothetical protein
MTPTLATTGNEPTATDAVNPQDGKSQEIATTGKTYSQEEFDNHIAGLKHSLTKKFEKQFAELGDIEELKALKTQAEQRRQEESMKKGEFEKILQEKLSIKDAEISKREAVIREFKVDLPLVNAAAKFRAVNPEQVKALVKTNVRLNDEGEVEVLDNNGQVRYSDKGRPVTVEDFVGEWLAANPHFVQSTPATTNAKSGISSGKADFDPAKLDLTDPTQRALYAEWRKSQYSNIRKMA